jgi:hypothetical protein
LKRYTIEALEYWKRYKNQIISSQDKPTLQQPIELNPSTLSPKEQPVRSQLSVQYQFKFKRVSVTVDCLYAAVGDANGYIILIDIDDYFHRFLPKAQRAEYIDVVDYVPPLYPPLEEAATLDRLPNRIDAWKWRDHVFSKSNTFRSDNSILHWYERNYANDRSWHDTSNHVKTWIPITSTSANPNHALNGFRVKNVNDTPGGELHPSVSSEMSSDLEKKTSPTSSSLLGKDFIAASLLTQSSSPLNSPNVERRVEHKLPNTNCTGSLLLPIHKNAVLSFLSVSPLSILARVQVRYQ